MPTDQRSHEIADLRIGIPQDFYAVRLDEAQLDSASWANTVIAEASEDSPGAALGPGLADELADLRRRLLGQLNPWQVAAVHLRAAPDLIVAGYLTFQILDIDEGQDAAWFAAEAQRLSEAADQTEVRSLLFESWVGDLPAGPFAGVHQVFEQLGDERDGWVEGRTVFGVFPPNATQMVQIIVTVEDLAAFPDMPADTQRIAETLEVDLEPIA
ncbi:hypothetical protein GCM10027515_33010 [Schumannella luteola]|uniref:Uncharacterized protein n=1 Tax=Schumannella luteola TaxID=472059 RepID=A0A852YMD4_9MICO|nr:hypothetical protein [Schumannella luteola]NYG98899.1 hypothetical protein [Schumannella luteola]TPX06279.1 hypothetical protein FJ656_01140 [Schumannella luteola]